LRDWLKKHIDKASKANFDQKFLAMLKSDEGRAAMKSAGFVHKSEFDAVDNAQAEITGQLEQLRQRVEAIEARRARRKAA
jgi:BMFP domain-containing protein YqiC